MYLNSFKKADVIEVYDQLFDNRENLNGLMFDCNFTLSREQMQKYDYLELMYDADFHRIIVTKFDPNEPLYRNQTITSILCPKKVFMEKIKPSETYYFIEKHTQR